MKRHAIIFTAFLGVLLLTHAQAQTATAPPPEKLPAAKPKPPPTATTTTGTAATQQGSGRPSHGMVGGILEIIPGPLTLAVEQVEAAVPDMRAVNGTFTTMPNVIFGPGTENATLPAPLKLRDVSPVQALALLAAATGCTLEPIVAPVEPPDQGGVPPADPFAPGPGIYQGGKIIGYRFERPAPVSATAPLQRAGYSSLQATQRQNVPAKSSKSTTGTSSTSGSGASALPGSGGNAFPANPVADGGSNPPAAPALGASANTLGGLGGEYGGGFGSMTGGGYGSMAIGVSKPAAKDEATVRVYAMGAVLRGSTDAVKEKEDSLKSLVADALGQADLVGDNTPQLSFHPASKTLIVKGTAAQHAIVDQIISAMKENELSETNTKQIESLETGGKR